MRGKKTVKVVRGFTGEVVTRKCQQCRVKPGREQTRYGVICGTCYATLTTIHAQAERERRTKKRGERDGS